MKRMSALTRSIERQMRVSGVPGLSAAFVERDQVVWSEGFGVCRDQSGDPISAETVFAVASLSKPPFAHIVLRLCSRGILDLDTPLADLYPEPYEARGLDPNMPELRLVTARQVLSHSSGLGNFEDADVGRIGFPPGSRWHYSGEGYLYLQTVVEHLTGLPLEQVAEVEVFEPLEMTSTSYRWRPEAESVAGTGDDRPSTEGHEFTKAFAAWSLHTTAREYARFVVDTLQSKVGDALLIQQVEIDDSLGWGLGWGLAGDVFWHWGDMGDFQSVAVASRADRRGLVCLTNSDQGLNACAEILREVLGDGFSYPIRAVLERGW